MIIESLKIVNFLSHEDTEINFEPGINIITGKNGAGKTGVLDAIKFALFAESRNNEKNNELIKKGKNYFEITLNFNINGEHYEVYRHFGVKKAKNAERLAYVKRDGTMVAETYEGVNAEITKILNVSKEVFKNSVFVEQGQMDSLITGTPKERKTIFSDIIGLTSLSKSAEKIRDIIANFRDQALTLQGANDRIKDLNSEIKDLESQKSDALQALAVAERKTEDLAADLEKIKNMVRERDEILSRIKNLESNIYSYRDEINIRKGKIKGMESDLLQLKSKLDRLNALESNPYYIKRDAINKYFIKKTGISNLEKDIRRLETSNEEYNNYSRKIEELAGRHMEYSELKRKYNENNGQIIKYRESHERYSNLVGIVKSLRARIDSENAFVQKFLETGGMRLEELADSASRREKINQEIISKKTRISEIKSTVVSYNSMLGEIRENEETLRGKSKCPLCGTELTEDHMAEISEEYREREEKILASIDSLKVEKQKIDSEIAQMENMYRQLNSHEVATAVSYLSDIKSTENELSRLESELGSNYSGHKLFMDKSAENDAISKKLEEYQKYEDDYVKYSNIISGINITELIRELGESRDMLMEARRDAASLLGEIGFEPDPSEYEKIESISKEIENMRSDVERARNLKASVKSINDEIEERNRSIIDVEKKLSDAREQLNTYKDVDTELRNAENTHSDSIKEQTKFSTLVETYSERINEDKNTIGKLQGDAGRYSKLMDTISTLNKIRESFDYNGIQSMIRKDASASMTNLTRKYLQSFNLDFDDIGIDENFDIKVTQNSMEQTLESLSGGEKTALAIALRLSVTEYVLDRISTIIMDEPTNFLDEDRRNNLKDIILYSLKGDNIVPQMIMITHHSELISVADSSYEMVKHNGTTRVISS
ncbi:MAG: AAA family ATPase [Ferroplasma sp.]|uniref:AAA family ATPase n=1 Tax=Ferroplasma sp. TaxID=2591003 RepID=UPI00281554AF|nr:AAA family ATPase [Ferroplasma sp.]WMT51774.1 MAG: AAA family ATPase [Ferroplasma sp.]